MCGGCTSINQYCIHGLNGRNVLEEGNLEYSHERIYIYILILQFLLKMLQITALKDIEMNYLFTKAVHFKQKGNISTVFLNLGSNNINQLHIN